MDIKPIKGIPINIVEDFKRLGSYVGSTERDIETDWTRMGSFCQTQVNIKFTEDQTLTEDNSKEDLSFMNKESNHLLDQEHQR